MMRMRMPVLVGLGGLLLGAALWMSGVDGVVQGWLWVNYHQGMNDVMRVLGELGKGTMVAGVCALAAGGLWFSGRLRMAKDVGMAVPVFAAAGALNWVLKVVVGRPRPKEWLMNGVSPWDVRPLSMDAGWWSFPSGHSCSVVAVAVWLGLCFPRWRTPLWGGAGALSASRFLAVTPHYLGDVVAGAGVGAAVALAIWAVWEVRRG